MLAVAAGNWHSLALRADGTIIAWGDNSLGQATAPPGLSNVVAIACGGDHSLALRSDGTVAAWGSDFGADGMRAGQADVPPGLEQVVAIAGGGFHSLALKADGTVVAWGDNSRGQATVPSVLSRVVAIAAGGGQSLAVQEGGTVMAWGDNLYHESVPGAIPASVTTVAAGAYHSLALFGQAPAGPRLSNPVRNGNAFAVSVTTLRGKAYFLQYKDSLAATNWRSSSALVGDGSLRHLGEFGATAANRFYRVRQQ